MLVVENMEESVAFYKEIFGLQVIRDFGTNVMLTEGLVLQQKAGWEEHLGKEVSVGKHGAVLYFVENALDEFLKKLQESRFDIVFLQEGIQEEGNRRVVRIYDPSGHVVEIGEYK